MRVVVVGRDAALWLAATVLARALWTSEVSVAAVELPTRLHAASTYASLPPLEALHAKLGIEEAALLRATGGAFSLGHNFVDATGVVPPFFHAWGSCGAPVQGDAFLPHWIKARRYGLEAGLQDFCPGAVAAKNGRLLLPDDATDAFGRSDYAYHLPAMAYVGYLKGIAPRVGVQPHRARSVCAERAEDGAIAALTLDGGERVAGDLFVDASGADAVLIGGALGVTWDSWRAHFPADRRLIARGARLRPLPAYAEQRAWGEGWTRLHPDQTGTSVVQVHDGDRLDDETALRGAEATARMPLADVVVERIEPGRRRAAWTANCVAIGEAAALFDPVHGVELQAVQLGIVHLLSLFPGGPIESAGRAEYNRRIGSLFERLRDFQSAAYVPAPYAGVFWERARRATPSAELAHRIATFRARGELAPMEDDGFLPDSWHTLFTGLGVMPDSWPPAIDRVPPERVKAAFRGMFEFIGETVRRQPLHDDYLRESLAGIDR